MDNTFPPEESPVFIFGCCWRCGSTLLQRLLSSSPDLFIWGENGGISTHLSRVKEDLSRRRNKFFRARENFAKDGLLGWIGNLYPEFPLPTEVLYQFYLSYYLPETQKMNKNRWGFKEVRHGAKEAQFLLDLFPNGRILFLMRNPFDVVASMSPRKWYDRVGRAKGVVSVWMNNVESISALSDPRIMKVRYESLVEHTGEELERIGKHLGIPPDTFDMSLMDKKISGIAACEKKRHIGSEEIKALINPKLRKIAKEEGYSIDIYSRLTSSFSNRIKKVFCG